MSETKIMSNTIEDIKIDIDSNDLEIVDDYIYLGQISNLIREHQEDRFQ